MYTLTWDADGDVQGPPVTDEVGQERHQHLPRGPEYVNQVSHQGLVPGAGDLHRQDAHRHEGPQGPKTREHSGDQEESVGGREGGNQGGDCGDDHRGEHQLLTAKPISEEAWDKDPEEEADSEAGVAEVHHQLALVPVTHEAPLRDHGRVEHAVVHHKLTALLPLLGESVSLAETLRLVPPAVQLTRGPVLVLPRGGVVQPRLLILASSLWVTAGDSTSVS